MRYVIVLAALIVLAPVVAVSNSADADCRGDCVGNGNARDGRECFGDVEAQSLEQMLPAITANGTSCPEQQTLIGARVSRGKDGCNRVDVFYCPTAVSGVAGGLRLDRQPSECFSTDQAADFSNVRHTIQANGTVCPANQAVMTGVKLQLSNGCWRVPAAYCQPPRELLVNGDFEQYVPPALGPPGWVSDTIRQIAAKSETNQPHGGAQNGACWATSNLDCGMFQDVQAPSTGQYIFTVFANADRPAGLVGVNVNGIGVAAAAVVPRGFGNYGTPYTLTFSANRDDIVRVWMYSPASPGYVVIDDTSLTMAF